MPRPGPRPYECVRRAWHSERHQPLRGSLIQEIFRVVSEVHSSKTKRNKEWQEKLPIVVLKAEEIMYSKANSEVRFTSMFTLFNGDCFSEDEYMDLQTLWYRVNDAINTIIRRDDSEETGDLLQPCIEAALQLGCVPRRASRSQRDNVPPRCYLSPNPQEPMSSCQTNLKNSITSPHCMAMYSDMFNRSALSLINTSQGNIPFKNFPLPVPPRTDSSKLIVPHACTSSAQGHSVYPLCPWSSNQGEDPQLQFNSSLKKTSTDDMDPLNNPVATRFSETPQIAPLSCDLSLRLGPYCNSEDMDNHSCHQDFRNAKSKNPRSKELHLFPKEGAGKFSNMDESSKKRKALPLTQAPCPAEQILHRLQPRLAHNHNTKTMKYPGL